MSFDGVFVHHLLNEIKTDILKQRINKINCLDNSSFIFSLANRKQLFISLNADSSHFRFTENEYIPALKTFPLLTIMKKYLESSIVSEFYQIENDRIIVFAVDSFDDLGFSQKILLIIEFFGRNSNLIITDKDYIIIDCYKKTFVLSDNDKRILVPKMKYQIPQENKPNPFKCDVYPNSNIYQGVSNLLYNEIMHQNNINVINTNPNPVIIYSKNKYYFYCFDLTHLDGEKRYFPTISKMLEDYYLNTKNQNIHNAEQQQIEIHIRKEITKALNKLHKQEKEKTEAFENLKLEQLGNLLSSNLYLVRKNAVSLSVNDYYNNNVEVTIPLNPLLTPSKNLDNIFNKYKKAKRAIIHLDEQIEATKNEITYLKTLEEQLKLSKAVELREIVEELKLNKKTLKPKKKIKPQLTTFHDFDGNTIMVGKNNIQNNYLTHTLAKKTDYFFHVKDAPGSHTILRTNELTSNQIVLAAMIAAYYSKNKNSSNVAVDYTLVRHVKKVPKTKGSFVTYTNYKTAYVTPDFDFIKRETT